MLNTIPPASASRAHASAALRTKLQVTAPAARPYTTARVRPLDARRGATSEPAVPALAETRLTIHCETSSAASTRGNDASCLHEHELHLIGAAPARLRVGNGIDEETHRFAPGTVVLLGPRLPHSLAFEHRPMHGAGNAGSLVLRFGDEPLRRGMELFPELRDAAPLLARARQGVQFVGLNEGIVSRLRRIEMLQGLARFAEFTVLLNELSQWSEYRLLADAAFTDDSLGEPGAATRIHKALDHIRDNYAEELSLAEVGAVVGMRENAFSRSFRRATGQTFTDFVIGLRVARACRLLASTRQQVSSICYEVGFNNISNFNRHFRRIKGMTPGEFRAGTQETQRPGAFATPAP
ncbi:AraC-like DNA-binding protein [Variovorax boronicumulans]|uniref:AraC family transcriptional regulator n=1 Tax=Variovorax boronicumulans TaxID=436515 RepID=UPI00278B5746|nr:AraC family transcriptional regulator [Variovorax boronicumulans]MDQ0014038.1 AraC-like DNA-binding protein [Variovorax boronicumulans]